MTVARGISSRATTRPRPLISKHRHELGDTDALGTTSHDGVLRVLLKAGVQGYRGTDFAGAVPVHGRLPPVHQVPAAHNVLPRRFEEESCGRGDREG